MNFISWSYLAGFFDGEGCIGLYHKTPRYTRVLVSVSQAVPREQILNEIQDFLQAEGFQFTLRLSSKAKVRRGYQEQDQYTLYCVNRTEALRFLKKIEPFLRVKKVKAKEVIAWLDENPVKQRGARRRPIKKSRVKEMQRMSTNGISQEEIGRQFGYTQRYVSLVLRRNLRKVV